MTAAAGTCWRPFICASAATTIPSRPTGSAIKLLGATAAREAGLGEAIAAAAGGQITADAQAAFAARARPSSRSIRNRNSSWPARWRSKAASPMRSTAWKAMRGGAAGRLALAGGGRPGACRSQQPDGRRRCPGASRPGPGRPSADEMAAASQMSPQDRNAMIETMVARLDERLKENPQRRGRLAAPRAFLPGAGQDRRGARCAGAGCRSTWRKDASRRRNCRHLPLRSGWRGPNDAQAEAADGDRRRHGFPGAGGRLDLCGARPEDLLFLHAGRSRQGGGGARPAHPAGRPRRRGHGRARRRDARSPLR